MSTKSSGHVKPQSTPSPHRPLPVTSVPTGPDKVKAIPYPKVGPGPALLPPARGGTFGAGKGAGNHGR